MSMEIRDSDSDDVLCGLLWTNELDTDRFARRQSRVGKELGYRCGYKWGAG